MRPTPLLLVALFALSGCTAPTDEPGDDEGGVADDQALAGTYAPWTVSDFWTFDVEIRGFDRYTETTIVYYEESGPEFVVGTPHYDEALYHAVFSVNPLLGRIHKELLSPHERGEHAHMFPFHKDPVIQDGETWTTTFYARPLVLRAAYAESVYSPDGARPGFVIIGEDPNSGFRVTYNYVRDAKWFTEMRVVDEDGLVLELLLREHGTGHKGPAHFIRASDYVHETLTVANLVPAEHSFLIPGNDVDRDRVESLAISVDIALRSGLSATLTLRNPSGQEIFRQEFDDEAVSREFNIEEIWPTGAKSTKPLGERPQWPSGTYTVRLDVSGQGDAEVHIVGTQDNSGRV